MTPGSQSELFAVPAPPGLAPRPYQIDACESACHTLLTLRSTLVVLPTGTGKTALAGMLAQRVKEAGGRTLFLAPTITLVEQTYKAIRGVGFGLECGIEQADNYVSRPLPDVTVGSVATMRGKRLRQLPRDSYSLVVVDEAHRAPGGTAYREILAHFADAKVVGLSATPERADGLAMANIFESIAYRMHLLDAITAGWLCQLEFRTVHTDWDPKRVKEVAGQVSVGSVEAELVRSGLLHEAAGSLAELGADRKILAFLPTVAASKAFMVELSARGLTCAHIDGDTPAGMRDDVFRRFRAGEIRVLVNCAVLIEGFDQPDVNVVAILSPTRSCGRLTQMIGRGTRKAPGKENCLILDFCPGRLQKGRLASPADALAGRMLDDDVFQAMSDEGDLVTELAAAQAKAEELRERKLKQEQVAKERRERLEKLRREVRAREISYDTQAHSTVEIFGGQAPVPDDENARRRARGLCSVKQANLLRRHGLNPDLPWRLASEAIGAIADNAWQLPDRIRLDRRFQVPPRPAPKAAAE